MNLLQLLGAIESTHRTLADRAARNVNTALTLRNWMIGFYMVEFEQKGTDRAKYGDRLLDAVTQRLKARGVPGISVTGLILFREFYRIYPQFSKVIPENFRVPAKHTPRLPRLVSHAPPIYQTVSDKSAADPALLLDRLTFSHFVELLKVQDAVQRSFCESQAMRGPWSVRELKRQIGSLLFERLAKSKNKSALMKRIPAGKPNPEEIIKNPYVFEFLNIPEKAAYTENDLEKALITHLHDFLLELGKGFCFEARQKRITINNQHYYIDLLFYHRFLKCHVLIELKTREFSHADAGQMNFYLNYMRENEMVSGDNPPVGIILCTHGENAEIKYATAGVDNKLFVSRYRLQLPTSRELRDFLKKDIHLLREQKQR